MVRLPYSFLLLLLFCIGMGSVQAAVEKQLRFPARLTIDNYGIYQLIETTQQSFTADATAGYESVINTRLLAKVKTIPLQKGVVFGFNYSIADASTQQAWVPVTIQIQHPLTTNYLGQQSLGFTRKSSARLKSDGRYHNGAFYVFSEPYEMVAGDWVITVTYGDEVIVSQRFKVIAR